MGGGAIPEIERPRSATELIGATFALYRRYSWLFLILAGVMVVPYELISLIGGPGGPLYGIDRVLVNLALEVGNFALVIPLISVLHLYAVEDLRAGREPELAAVARRGVASLRVVSPAVLLSWLGIFAGLIALIVPGVLLALRWAVVAQAGALEATSWRNALDRSAGLTERHRGHVLGLFALILLITAIPTGIHIAVFGASRTVGSFVVGTAFDVVTSSFTALATAFLYFDLKTRFRTDPARGSVPSKPQTSSGRVVPPTGHPLDPESWSDEDRPGGWYIDPVEPIRMRYWPAGHEPQWSKRRARTPNKTYDEWTAYRKRAKAEELPEEPV
jgi:hypothetical protein